MNSIIYDYEWSTALVRLCYIYRLSYTGGFNIFLPLNDDLSLKWWLWTKTNIIVKWYSWKMLFVKNGNGMCALCNLLGFYLHRNFWIALPFEDSIEATHNFKESDLVSKSRSNPFVKKIKFCSVILKINNVPPTIYIPIKICHR